MRHDAARAFGPQFSETGKNYYKRKRSKMKQLIESGKKYTLWDCVFIPIRVSPVPAVIIIILRIIVSLTPSLTVIFTAAFTDNVLAAAALCERIFVKNK